MWPADPALRLTRERLQLASCARASSRSTGSRRKARWLH